MSKQPLISARRAEILDEAEDQIMAQAKPDPESLVFSDKVRDEILPSMIVVPEEKPIEQRIQQPKDVLTEFFGSDE